MRDYRLADLSEREKRLCDFAILLTLKPAKVQRLHLDHLRDSGITDEQITVANQVIGYFNYINRIADGLGVEPEDWMEYPSHQQWELERGTDYLESLPDDKADN
ncbi:MAG: hypothetical protein VYA84_09995 [Planctomycetota bacterium]|nr:hypothetical protein [Planctomycetota bacterium]